MFNNIKNNLFLYSGIAIGSISLIESYKTIVLAVLPFMGLLSYAVPISIDILVIVAAYGATIYAQEKKGIATNISRSVSYICIGISWYLNNIDSFSGGGINVTKLSTHTAIVIAWIYCTENIIYLKKLQFLKRIKKEENEIEFNNELNNIDKKIIISKKKKELEEIENSISILNTKQMDVHDSSFAYDKESDMQCIPNSKYKQSNVQHTSSVNNKQMDTQYKSFLNNKKWNADDISSAKLREEIHSKNIIKNNSIKNINNRDTLVNELNNYIPVERTSKRRSKAIGLYDI